MPMIQVLIRKHLRPSFEGDEPRTVTHDYRVDAEYVPADSGNRECPPTDEGFDIDCVYSPCGIPLLLSDRQLLEIEEIMLDNVHMNQEDERAWRERDRYTD